MAKDILAAIMPLSVIYMGKMPSKSLICLSLIL